MTIRQATLVGAVAAATGGMFALSFRDYWLFHSTVETIVVVLAGITSFVGLTSQRLRKWPELAFMAATQGGVAVLTFLHSRAFLGFNFYAGQADDAGVHFRTLALVLEAVVFALAMTPLAKRISAPRAFVVSLAASVVAAAVVFGGRLPPMVIGDTQLTGLFHASQVALCLVFAALLAAGLWIRFRPLGAGGPGLLVLAAIAAHLLSETTMVLAVHMAVEANFFAHAFKIAAHALLLGAVARAAGLCLGESQDVEARQAMGQERDRARMLEAILDAALERVLLVDAEGIVRHINRPLERELGLPPGSGIGRPCAGGVWPQDLPCLAPATRRLALETGRAVVDECEFRRPGGTDHVHLEYRVTPLVGHPGVPDGTVMVCRDVTAQKHLEEELRASLENNRTLMMEMHHRVKNNLHIVTSILQMKAWRSRDTEVRQRFEDACGRILSLAKVHEMLYRERTFSSIDFGEYARILCDELLCMCGAPRDRIHLDMACEALTLHVDQAIPLGLILHELVTNCLKHAFSADGGRITVILREDSESRRGVLRVEDDGTGAMAGAGDDDTFGLRMVDTLVAQLRGRIDRAHDAGGTIVTVSFPLQGADEPEEFALPLTAPVDAGA